MLENIDLELIHKASEVIILNYDKDYNNHTVGAAVRCKNGNVYTGINLYSLHGVCAEQVAIGSAVSHGELEFECIVAVRGEKGNEVLSPCGNCRQMLADYMPKCWVIVNSKNGLIKVTAENLLPYAYKVEP